MIKTILFRGISTEVETSQIAANMRLSEMQEEAHRRATELVPGRYWTSGLSVILVALSQQPLGTMTVARANQIIADAGAIWAALNVAENAVQAVLDGEGTEAEKIAAIDAIWPEWPEEGE